MAARLPEPAAIKKLWAELLGRGVTVEKASEPMKVERQNPDSYTALYVTKARTVPTIISCDRALAAHGGAALALLPPEQPRSWVNAGQLSAEAAENLYEILNIMAATLNEVNLKSHVKLSTVLPPGKPVPPPITVVDKPVARLDLVVNIDGYASGRMSILTI
jgi:hypothetical protein